MKIHDKVYSFFARLFWQLDSSEKILVGCMGLFFQNLPFFFWSYEDLNKNIITLRFISSIISFWFIFHQTFFSDKENYHIFLWVFYITFSFYFSPLFIIYQNPHSLEWALTLILSVFVASYVFPIYLSFTLSSIVVVTVFINQEIIFKVKEVISFGWIISAIFGFIFLKRKQEYTQKLREVHKRSVMTIIHEIATPLASISLLSQNLLRRKNLKEDSLNKIISISEKTSKTIRGFSTLFSEKHLDSHIETVRISSIIKSTIEENRNSLHKNIEISVKDDQKIKTNPNTLYFVFLNIIKNASFFCRKVKGSRIKISVFQIKEKTCVTIRDNSIGIEKQKIPFVFDVFFSEREGGLGLGLYFCKKAIEDLGGYISCKSELGNFTEFYIELRSLK